ncbi:MAG TPA: hypothetical protein VKV29_13540 [Chthonomonas sp.]|uniref:hypothetical protein n=1 Tax=Chthonomonas sp. TaxID=2282153 RepID=UPI002B4B828A|nr:hypothetical protein [Chthonomonas sp.]HLH81291.1 hypothetical protein [Chthonomonas sp.]
MKTQVTVWPLPKPPETCGRPEALLNDETLRKATDTVLQRYGARAVTLLSSPRPLEDGRLLPPRLSANDCYVALEEACRKMARVALRQYHAAAHLQGVDFSTALDSLFPDPVAYLSRCIRSVISDAERIARREVPTVSLDQPIGDEDEGLCLRDVIADTSEAAYPEASLIEKEERARFRQALAQALRALPQNYLEALKHDIARERQRQQGQYVPPETDRERQAVCRARATLLRLLRQQCDADNPFLHVLLQSKTAPGRRQNAQPKSSVATWNEARKEALRSRLLQSTWAARSANTLDPQGNVDEAIVNEVSFADGVEPPSPEMRKTVRVLDTYTIGDRPTSTSDEAQALYEKAWQLRKGGKLEEAVVYYKRAFEKDSMFYPALTEAGATLIQQGHLREALQLYQLILTDSKAGDERYIAANNIADIYLTWFDAGRNREKNIERALYYAQIAVQKPTPMRVVNLLLAYVKDHYYIEAKRALETALKANWPSCPPDKLLQTLFQIRDPDLVSWWNWLETELGKENPQ